MLLTAPPRQCKHRTGSARFCPECDGKLTAKRGVEVGNIFKLGTRYTEALGATFLEENGKPQPIIMGSYGIGVGRLLACVAEEYHDDYGLIWPISVAPYPLHLVLLNSKDGSAEGAAETLYQTLVDNGLEPLYDDRDERAGVKFNDADLVGLPLRVTVSALNLAKKPLNGSRVLVLGVAYKPNVDDLRESPALDVIHLLQTKGADVAYHDPFIPHLDHDNLLMDSVTDLMAEVKKADCVAIITDHENYDYMAILDAAQMIVDTRNALGSAGKYSPKVVRL